VVTDDGFYKNKRSRRLFTEGSGLIAENQNFIENHDSQNDENSIFYNSDFWKFQKDTVSELNIIKNSAIENYGELNLTIQNNHSNSVTSIQILIDMSELNQSICKKIQSLIINNHSQLIEEFTSISTLVQSLKESFGNHISNIFEEQMKQVKIGNDNSLQEQFMNETKKLLQDFQNKTEILINQTLEKLLYRSCTETKADLQQIFIKLNDKSLQKKFKKSLEVVKEEIVKVTENQRMSNDLLEMVANDAKKDVNQDMGIIMNRMDNQDQNMGLISQQIQGNEKELNKLVEGSLVILNSIEVADKHNEKRKIELTRSVDEVKSSVDDLKNMIE
jgi:hypothetical protein